MTPDYFQYLARYNQWANRRIYDAAAGLDEAGRRLDRGAFFGSIHRTLNHIVVADRIWMARFAGEPPPHAELDAVPFDDFEALRAARRQEDRRILDLMGSATGEALEGGFSYRNMTGVEHTKPRGLTYGHFFNHQTHHRGQVHAMISMAGAEPPPLDYIYFLDEALAA